MGSRSREPLRDELHRFGAKPFPRASSKSSIPSSHTPGGAIARAWIVPTNRRSDSIARSSRPSNHSPECAIRSLNASGSTGPRHVALWTRSSYSRSISGVRIARSVTRPPRSIKRATHEIVSDRGTATRLRDSERRLGGGRSALERQPPRIPLRGGERCAGRELERREVARALAGVRTSHETGRADGRAGRCASPHR